MVTMKKNTKTKTIIKGIITVGSAIAVNGMLSYYTHWKSNTVTKFLSDVAGYAIGFTVGQIAGDCVNAAIDRAANAFKETNLDSEE